MFGHGSPPKNATAGLQQVARDAFQVFLKTAARWLDKPPQDARVKRAVFRLWSLSHGIAALALERQILFDVPAEALLAEARGAMAVQLSATKPNASRG